MNIYKLYRFFSPILAWTEGRQRQEKHKIKTGQDNTVQLFRTRPQHTTVYCATDGQIIQVNTRHANVMKCRYESIDIVFKHVPTVWQDLF